MQTPLLLSASLLSFPLVQGMNLQNFQNLILSLQGFLVMAVQLRVSPVR